MLLTAVQPPGGGEPALDGPTSPPATSLRRLPILHVIVSRLRLPKGVCRATLAL